MTGNMRMLSKLLLVAVVAACSMVAYAGQRTDLEKIRASVRKEYLDSRVTPDSVRPLVSTLGQDGSWADIDYANTSRTGWQHAVHLDRLIAISQACRNATSEMERRQLLEAVERGLTFWFAHDFVCENWWENKIGTPRRMLAIGYILDDDLDSNLRRGIIRTISVIDVNDYPARPGGDRIQVASNHAKALFYRRDVEGLARIFRVIEQEASFAPMEEIMYDAAGGLGVRNRHRPSGRGVQADFSFHHRGDRVNSTLTYGLELPEYYSYWALLLRHTAFSFDPAHTRFVIDYYLDGVCKHLIGGRQKEPGACNRDLVRPDEQCISATLSERLLQLCDGYRRTELQNYHEAQTGGAYEQPSFARFFWCSEYFMFQRPRYVAAVRMHSVRNMNMEYPHNGEGIRNHFRGDGACHLSVSGDEYVSTLPVYDFSHIPGTTVLSVSTFPPADEVQKEGKSVFVGAVTDSLYGAAAFDFISPRQKLQARKGYFFFDEGYVCLGSGICSDEAGEAVTTIEQCRAQGPVVLRSGVVSPLGGDRLVSDSLRWVWHNGVGYFCLEADSLEVSCVMRQGRWQDCTLLSSYDTLTVEKQLFSLLVRHGSHVCGGQYAYAVAPGLEQSQMDSCAASPFWHVWSNTDAVQAVSNADASLLYVIFYEAGRFRLGDTGQWVGADQPCVMMVRDGKVYVSDPTRKLHRITVEYNGRSAEVPLPTWLRAGISVPVHSSS